MNKLSFVLDHHSVKCKKWLKEDTEASILHSCVIFKNSLQHKQVVTYSKGTTNHSACSHKDVLSAVNLAQFIHPIMKDSAPYTYTHI